MKKDPQKLRDGAGHLTAGVAADLLARSRGEGAAPRDDRALFRDPLAEQLGESFLAAATGSEDADDETEAQIEESGGPFVETTSQIEVALGTDASNPSGSLREPFPLT